MTADAVQSAVSLTRYAATVVVVAVVAGCGGDSPPTVEHSTRAVPQGPVLWLRPAPRTGAAPRLLSRNAARLAVIHPTSLHLRGVDRVDANPGLHATIVAAKAANPRVLVVPAVVDDELASDPQGIQALRRMLLDHTGGSPGRLMKQHVAMLVKVATPYDGLAVDYEFSFDSLHGDVAPIRDGFTVFIQTLRRALPRNQVLAVAVRARSAGAPMSPAQAVYDYRRLGRVVDLIEVAAYDHAWPTSEPG